ncbi:hypothetical protein Pmani_035483 [Petrolisthes manimaculis]|uniref:Uncharacterized protein n=1 Tax=Petrolisthes manimaculis TaxID=1843537 RepID=A0AAE1TN63_9EUCA|nr:hypothetical protein Pmani_035483 [Petrolisthes manimaculis]
MEIQTARVMTTLLGPHVFNGVWRYAFDVRSGGQPCLPDEEPLPTPLMYTDHLMTNNTVTPSPHTIIPTPLYNFTASTLDYHFKNSKPPPPSGQCHELNSNLHFHFHHSNILPTSTTQTSSHFHHHHFHHLNILPTFTTTITTT